MLAVIMSPKHCTRRVIDTLINRLMVDSDDADSDDPEYAPRPEWAKGEVVFNRYPMPGKFSNRVFNRYPTPGKFSNRVFHLNELD